MARALLAAGNTTVRGEYLAAVMPDMAPRGTARISVDLDRQTISLDGKSYDVASIQALRWVRVLARSPGVWLSGRETVQQDPELAGSRTERLRTKLPREVQELIESQPSRGSRLRVV
jgi:hypothetical protein